jgi:integrase
MATITPRPGPNGKRVWQAQIRKKGYPRQFKTFDRKTDGVKWARMVEREMDEGTWRNLKGAESVLLKDALEKYLNEVSIKKRPRTADRDRLSASYLRNGLGLYTLAQTTPDKVAAYRDRRLKLVSPHSVRIELALLSHLFNIARREWGVGQIENPVSVIEKPEIPEGRCPILSEAQIKRLLDECKASRSELLYAFALLTLHSGCRSMEIRSLPWSQVNLEEGYIVLIERNVKNKKTRVVPLTGPAQEILKGLADKQMARRIKSNKDGPVGLVFPARANPDKPRDMHVAFDRAVKRAGLEDLPGLGKLRIHDLRHLCGTFLLMTGADVETVRTILGHRDISTTQRYLHVVRQHTQRAVDRIDHLGFGSSEDHSE